MAQSVELQSTRTSSQVRRCPAETVTLALIMRPAGLAWLWKIQVAAALGRKLHGIFNGGVTAGPINTVPVA
jgi:hypothetical protein